MKATKDIKTGKWMIQYRYTDWQGNRIKSTKRGFDTKREAEEWLREFLLTLQCDFNMLFSDLYTNIYEGCINEIKIKYVSFKEIYY